MLSLFSSSAASANVISPPPPHSPNAGEIATLYWIGLVAALLIIVVVNATLIFAVARYRAKRGAAARPVFPRRGIQRRVGGVLAAFAAAILVLSVIFTERARTVPPTQPTGLKQSARHPTPAQVTIFATGQQWLWRYQYPNGAFSYYQLVVPVNTTVRLVLHATDTVHSWYVPELGGKFDAIPGRSNATFFRADRLGNFYGSSAVFSGAAYATMRTEVSVVSPAKYRSFTRLQKSEVQVAQARVERLIRRNGGAPPGEPRPNAGQVGLR